MEFWAVVAAAGAGYVTQYLQSSSGNKDNLADQKQFSEISTYEQQSDKKNLLYKLRENYCPFRRLARKRAQKEVSDEGVFRFRQLNLDSSGKTSSTDCIDDEMRKTRCRGPFNSTGLPNGMALLYMGITTGMISAIIANKREVEKLNDKLNFTKNLVEDLQDELEMKEKIIIKDLAMSTVLPMSTSMPMSVSSSCDIQVDEPTMETSENINHMEAENRELSMSEIEAELEAELERLEMNLKVSALERISDFVELDSEDEVDVARGDLKLDGHNLQCHGPSESDRDSSETTRIDHSGPVDYPVSPRELSLRLHEVIESRLQAQIKELETALYNSQTRACSLEGQHIFSRKYYASSDSESSGYFRSPCCYHEADEEE